MGDVWNSEFWRIQLRELRVGDGLLAGPMDTSGWNLGASFASDCRRGPLNSPIARSCRARADSAGGADCSSGGFRIAELLDAFTSPAEAGFVHFDGPNRDVSRSSP